MAYDVNQIYVYLKFLINKNQAGGVSTTDFFYAWNSEQSAYQSDLLGRIENKNNGKTGPNTGLLLNETILNALAPFTQTVALPITTGDATKPSDFIYELAIRKDGFKVYNIKHGQQPYVTDSVLDPASVADNKYYATEDLDNYHVLPSSTTGDLTLTYIASCQDVVWGFTLDGNGRRVYDAATSVQPLWDANSIITITKRALKAMGVHFKDQDFTNFGQSNISTGD